MLRLTIPAAAVALLLASSPATAADTMSADEYERAIAKCQAADTTAKRDDCLTDARERYEQGKLDRDASDNGKDLARKVDDKVPDRKLDDGPDLSKRDIKTSVPDKLKE